MNKNITLSIIMPCYNMSDDLSRALNSIFMQKTEYSFEVIIVDDCSTDNTLSTANELAAIHENIIVLKNTENLGNAKTFYHGLCNASGKYFCVLDADDYYTCSDKLQKQLSFFESDTNEEYVAVTHHHVSDLAEDNIYISPQMDMVEFNYSDMLSGANVGYYHTSAYMYRNIFKENPLSYYNEVIFRGDTPRVIFHLMYSNKKVKVLNFVGSVYTFHYSGLWSSMTLKKQHEYQVNYNNALLKTVNTAEEQGWVLNFIRYYEKLSKNALDEAATHPSITIATALELLKKSAEAFTLDYSQLLFKHLYFSQYLDSSIASLGEVYRVNHPEFIQTRVSDGSIGIVIGALNPTGGGIFAEILELCTIHKNNKVNIFVTNMPDMPIGVLEIFKAYPNTTLIAPSVDDDKLEFFHKAFVEISPEKMYIYASHTDVYAQVLIRRGLCKNILLFSFDHGYICGLSNPNIDTIVAKRPCDYQLLSKYFKDKVIHIPTWNITPNPLHGNYTPFKEHTNLITACGAARFYKLDGVFNCSYTDCITTLLAKTNAKHYHFGEIPEDKLQIIYEKLAQLNVQKENFIYIPWENNIPQFILDNNVDIFIEPFPVVSYKLSLNVLSAGVPIISYNGHTRMQKMDFIYPEAIYWDTARDFIDILSNITAEELNRHSRLSIEYYKSTHDISIIKDYLLNIKHFPVLREYEFTDNSLFDVRDFKSLFGDDCKIDLSKEIVKAQRLLQEQEAQRILQEQEAQRLLLQEQQEAQRLLLEQEAQRILQEQQARIQLIKQSASYIIGLFGTISIKKLLGENIPYSDYENASIDDIYASNYYKLGRMITAPVRLIRGIFKK